VIQGKTTLGLQVAVTAILLWLLFRDFEWASLRTVLAAMPLWFYVGSFAAVLFGQLVYAYRWRLILVALGLRLPHRVVAEQYIVGIFFNNFLPSTVGGDWVKVYYLGRREGYLRVGASVLIDRVLGLVLLAALSVALLWATDRQEPAVVAARTVLTTALVALMLGLGVVLVARPWVERQVARWRRSPAEGDSVGSLFKHIARVARQPAVLAGSSLAVLAYFLVLGVVYQQFIAMATGRTPNFMAVTAIITAIATLSNVPISFNGLGVREQLHLALFAGFGLNREAAAGMSLLLFAHLLVISAAGAALWLRSSAAERSMQSATDRQTAHERT
jgi:uncharacterized protein (TIRG00374 family)